MTMAFPTPELPTKPMDMNTTDYYFKLEKYKKRIKRDSTHHFRDQDNNAQAYKMVILHCAPSMISMLNTMVGWIKVQEDQDWVGLIKLVHVNIFA